MQILTSLNPYNKVVDDRDLRGSKLSYADVGSVLIQRGLKQNELINKKIDALKADFEVLDELQHKDKKELEKDLVKVYFTNSSGSKITQVALSREAVIFLNKEFGEVYERKDGSFLLDGKSNAYLRGWYNEIALNQNYLKADANKDGLIDDEERLNLKSLFIPRKYALCSGDVFLYVSNIKAHRAFSELSEGLREKYQSFFTSKTLNLALDKAVRLDKDFDGILQYEDYDKNTYHNFIKDFLYEVLKDKDLSALDDEELNKILEQYKQEIKQEFAKRNKEKLKIIEDKEKDREKIYAKLLALKDLSTLSIEEKNLAKKYFPKLMQMLEKTQETQGFSDLLKLIHTQSFTVEQVLDLKA